MSDQLRAQQRRLRCKGKIFNPNLVVNENILGTMKLVRGASSGMIAFGSTNAPEDSSSLSGVLGEEGFAVNTTFAK